jgi:tRNA threonylcarbamoyladenosine biosynthesis protein TsaE
MAEPGPVILADPAATEASGGRFAAALLFLQPASLTIFLEGELGAGKTTFARGFLAGLGHQGRVPSPTYTLIEPYVLSGYRVCHIDLYRLRKPRELEDLGLIDELSGRAVALIEWPDHGAGYLPSADLSLRFEILPAGRAIIARSLSGTGRDLLARVAGSEPGPLGPAAA